MPCHGYSQRLQLFHDSSVELQQPRVNVYFCHTALDKCRPDHILHIVQHVSKPGILVSGMHAYIMPT